MAKGKELNQLKKGTSQFELVGNVKVNDYTFMIDAESKREDSDWVYSKMNVGVDCGDAHGTIYAEMQGGYGTDRNNVVYVHGKKKDDKGNEMDDFQNQFTIDWDDRHDEDILENLGKKCFVTVGLEKDEKGKTIYKKFVSEYDAVAYAQEHLEDGVTVRVKGDLQWSEYDGKIQVKKNITSIVLSEVKEEDFKATFTQMLLVEKDAIGKVDKETMTIPIDAYVLDHVQHFKGQNITKKVGNKVKKGTTLPLPKTFDVKVTAENKENLNKMLKLFKAKSKKVTSITVEGYFSRGDVETTTVTATDIPDDIKELIELGLVDEKEIMDKIAFANGGKNKPEQMFIKSPSIKVKKGEMPSIDRVEDAYDEDDINVDLILENFDTEMQDVEEEKEVDVNDVIDAALEDEDDDLDFLADL